MTLLVMRLASLMGITAVVAVGASRTAVADNRPEVALGWELESQAPGSRLVLTAVVEGGPIDAPLSSWTMAQVDVTPPRVVSAIARRERTSYHDRLAVALLVEGHTMFMGNDDHAVSLDDRWSGIFGVLPAVIRSVATLPESTTATVVVYGAGAKVIAPMQPVATLPRDLVEGAKEAMQALVREGGVRRALIVLGDGADTNIDFARQRLALLRREAEQLGIDLYAVNYTAGIGDELSAIKSLISDVTVVREVDEIVPAIQQIVDRIGNRYMLVFPAPQITADEHDYELRLDGKPFPDEHAVQTLTMRFQTCVTKRPESRGPWTLIGAASAALIAVGWLLRRRRRRAPQLIA